MAIKINDKIFVQNNKELSETLFKTGGTAVGFYRKYKNQIKLFNLQRELIGAVTKHRCLLKASKMKNTETGKTYFWYNSKTIPEIGEFPSYRKRDDDIRNLGVRFENCMMFFK